MRSRSSFPLAWLGFLVLVLLVLPLGAHWLHSGYWLRLFELSLIFSILAASLNLVTGTAGLVSLGHAAFYGIGAYTAALVSRMNGDLLATLPASLLVTGVLAGILAIPMLRLLRVFFTVATLSVGEIVTVVLTNWDGVTGGPNGFRGIPGFAVAGIAVPGGLGEYYVVAVVALVALWCVARLSCSFYGNALRALREDEASAGAMGLDTRLLKIGVFMVSGALAGVAGCLTAHSTRYISPDMFALDQSIMLLTMVVVGGLGSLPGAVLGAFLLTIAPEVLRTAGHFRMIMVGVLLFAAILLFPKGLLSEELFLRRARRTGGGKPSSGSGTGAATRRSSSKTVVTM